jgi:hypothetical protein
MLLPRKEEDCIIKTAKHPKVMTTMVIKSSTKVKPSWLWEGFGWEIADTCMLTPLKQNKKRKRRNEAFAKE